MDAATYSKSILKVGTYHSPDGVVHVTPERLRHWERSLAQLQSVGYAIPSHFDHASELDLLEPIAMDVLERKQNRSAQATVGKLESFKVAPDGNSAELVLTTLTPKASESVAKNAVYVSPVIFPEWKDGAGNRYKDVITSFDLVDHPVDFSQSSFVPAIKMGLRVCPAIRMGRSQPYYLGTKPMPKKTRKRNQQARKARFKAALNAGLVRMGSDYDPEEDDMSGADTEPAQDLTAEETPTPSDDPSPTEEIEVAAGDAPDLLDSVLNLLHEFGVTLPDDTTDANLISHLRVALTALLNAEDGEEEGVDDLLGDENAMPGPSPGDMPIASAPNIATMSLKKASVLEEKLRKIQRQSIQDSLQSLLQQGRCTPAEHDAMLRELGTVRMSVNAEGEFKPTRIDTFIEFRKSVPEGAFWSDQQRSQAIQKLSAVKPPTEWKGGGGRSTDDYAEAIRALGGKA